MDNISLDPFFNIYDQRLLSWAAASFLKCLYVSLSICKARVPPLLVVAVFTVLKVVYCINRDLFVWYFPFQFLDIVFVVYGIYYKDYQLLVTILSIVFYFVKPCNLIIDLLSVSFLVLDFITLFRQNDLFWLAHFVSNQYLSIYLILLNSRRAGILFLFKIAYNFGYFLHFWSVAWYAHDRSRSIPLFVVIIVNVMEKWTREVPVWAYTGGPREAFTRIQNNIIFIN